MPRGFESPGRNNCNENKHAKRQNPSTSGKRQRNPGGSYHRLVSLSLGLHARQAEGDHVLNEALDVLLARGDEPALGTGAEALLGEGRGFEVDGVAVGDLLDSDVVGDFLEGVGADAIEPALAALQGGVGVGGVRGGDLDRGELDLEVVDRQGVHRGDHEKRGDDEFHGGN